MSAAATVNPVVPPASAPSRPAAAAPASDDNRFDRHLDAARQQHVDGNEQPAHEDGHDKGSAKAPATAKADHGRATDAPAKDDGNPDAAALAAAMLALIGQAAPAKPLAQAGAVAPATARAAGTTAAAKAPAALVLLAGTAATAAVSRPTTGLDATALAPMLAKPAEQKDAPLDALQMATASTAQLPTPDSTAAAPTPTLTIASPAGTPAFAQELGQHVAWLGQQDVKQARIRLHPEDLGTLDVKVSLNHDRVDVSFAVQHPAAVHAVQQTLPQLDALLAQHGLALGHADVGQRQQQGEGGRGGEAGAAIGEIEPESVTMASTPVAALGMLATFA
jgi:flagellar hook-length control protein FliK